ncbi:hypothetical protein OG586_21825 [Streptomyces murinus]|uniref:hypothetical protein n=1 Tax=Streptomyces murinus TaxID=33900 RepID=UPI002E803B33|nr:hypothetical protein [Streptomyces murinus]WUD08679.1 hypothetical protein OG586_21825 [Streptomyces murinus]
MIGSESSRPGAFGGFHHPDQGYRHFQMMSVITMYGKWQACLSTPSTESTTAVPADSPTRPPTDTDRSATVPGGEEQTRYMAALSGYEGAVISGDATALGTWLDDRHGPGSFAGLFRTPEYFDA